MKIRLGFVSNSSSCSFTVGGRLTFEFPGLDFRKTNFTSWIPREEGWTYNWDGSNYLEITNNVNFRSYTDFIPPHPGIDLTSKNEGSFTGVSIKFSYERGGTKLYMDIHAMHMWEGHASLLHAACATYINLVYDALGINPEKVNGQAGYQQWASPFGDGWGGDPIGPGSRFDGNVSSLDDEFNIQDSNIQIEKGEIKFGS